MPTDIGTPYAAKSTVDGSDFSTALAFFLAVARSNSTPRYSNQFFLVDIDNTVLEDITPYIVMNNTPPSVSHDSTLDGVQGQCTFTYRRPTPLQWGSAFVRPYLLVQCDGVGGGAWYSFPRGVYVVTSPSHDLQSSIERQVTGYDKSYLLKSDQHDSMGWNAGSTYHDAIAECFVAAGLIADVSNFIAPFVNFSSEWAAKTIPSGQFRSFALTGSAQSYLAIINALLADSGQQNLWLDPNGGFQISELPTPEDDALSWTWVADLAAQASAPGGDHKAKIVLRENRDYNGDVYNVVNQWVFIQSGLTFLPSSYDGSDGMYLVDNMTRPPSDQVTTGRIIRHTEFLDASGQDDLVAQGNDFVRKALNSVETIKFSTAPWCVGWHYDVFLYADSSLPTTPVRRVQTQRWTLPLNGEPMSWETNVVGTT